MNLLKDEANEAKPILESERRISSLPTACSITHTSCIVLFSLDNAFFSIDNNCK